jgi:hypothetical protein
VTQTWLSDHAKEKLCRSNVTFISGRSTTLVSDVGLYLTATLATRATAAAGIALWQKTRCKRSGRRTAKSGQLSQEGD